MEIRCPKVAELQTAVEKTKKKRDGMCIEKTVFRSVEITLPKSQAKTEAANSLCTIKATQYQYISLELSRLTNGCKAC